MRIAKADDGVGLAAVAATRPTFGEGVAIDVDTLIVSKLLIQANSGGGKSYAIRRLLEQTFGIEQHIVIDVEGEFHTLREKYPYVLAGPGGDCPATVASAALLARKLLETGASCIIDISELGAERTAFVEVFLTALVNAPKALWRRLILVLDEAQVFAPEGGLTPCSRAVIDFMTRGRKRGLGAVLATQRISSLHKGAAADCNNKLIGRTALDIDVERAAKEIGLRGHEKVDQLRRLAPGSFFAYGPALSPEVVGVKIGPVFTTHPKAGQRTKAPLPPMESIRKVLAEIGDLPAEAEAEARTATELRAKIKQLEADVRAARTGVKPASAAKAPTETKLRDADVVRLENLIQRGNDFAARLSSAGTDAAKALNTSIETSARHFSDLRTAISAAVGKLAESLPAKKPAPTAMMGAAWTTTTVPNGPIASARRPAPAPREDRGAGGPFGALPARPAPHQKILDTLALFERLQITPTVETLAAWYGAHTRGGSFRNYLGALRSEGLLGGVELTPAGRAAANHIEPPTQEEARQLIMRPLPGPHRKILEIVLAAGGTMELDALATAYGAHARGGSFRNYLGALRTRQLLEKGTPIRAGAVLYLGGRP